MSMWTFIIDGPKAKLKLTAYEALSPAEWDQMIASLEALKYACVAESKPETKFTIGPEGATLTTGGVRTSTWTAGDIAVNTTGEPEAVLTPEETAAIIKARNDEMRRVIQERWNDPFFNVEDGLNSTYGKGPANYANMHFFADEEYLIINPEVQPHEHTRHQFVHTYSSTGDEPRIHYYFCEHQHCPTTVRARKLKKKDKA